MEIHWISSQVGLYSVLSRDPPEDICGDKKNAKMFTHRWVYTRCCGQSAKILKEHLQSVKVDFYLVSKVYFFICLAKYTFICLEKYISIHLSLYLHHSLSSQKKKIRLIHFIHNMSRNKNFHFDWNLSRHQNFHFHSSLLMNTFTFNVIS